MNVLNRRSAIVAALGLLGTAGLTRAADQPTVEVWKSPTCGCCKDWVTHMESHGFTVRVHDTGNKLGAWLTQSSEVITSRQILQGKMAELKRKFRDGRIPLPDKWGGYRVVPQRFEFWQAGQDDLHDRFEYSRVAQQTWEIKRLLP